MSKGVGIVKGESPVAVEDFGSFVVDLAVSSEERELHLCGRVVSEFPFETAKFFVFDAGMGIDVARDVHAVFDGHVWLHTGPFADFGLKTADTVEQDVLWVEQFVVVAGPVV